MTKLSSPLLSLKAQGSLADSLTFTRRRGVDIAESKPRLPYSLTLAQQYQRWLYQDYAYLWTQQSAATRAQYAAKAARRHTTPISEWLRYNLKNLPDIAGWWTLDSMQYNLTYDRSPNQNTAVVYGALPVAGRIGQALWFDAIDDRVNAGHGASLAITKDLTIEAMIYPTSHGEFNFGRLCDKGESILIYMTGPASLDLGFNIKVGGVVKTVFSSGDVVTLNAWHHIMAVFNQVNLLLYVDGKKFTGAATPGPIDTHTTTDLSIGNRAPLDRTWGGIIDDFIVRNRALDQNDAIRHAARRYP